MKGKVLSVLLSAAMVTTMFTGCGNAAPQAAASSAAPAAESSKQASSAAAGSTTASGDTKEITFMFWDDLNTSTDLITQLYKKNIDRFNAENNGYHVTTITTNLDDYYTKLNALIAAGTTPDVIILSPGTYMNEYQASGAIQPLNKYLDADSAWKDSFSAGMMDGSKYGDDIYGVPTNFAAACCYYNKDMFAKAGITEVPADWDSFIAACDKLKAAGMTPISCSESTAWCLSMLAGYCMNRNGVDYDALNEGKAHWTDDNVLKGINDMVTLTKYFQETALGDSNDQATANFYNEKAAMLIQGSWAIAQMNGANADIQKKCGVFSFPTKDGSAGDMIVKCDNLSMSATTKNPEGVIKFMQTFTDDTAQKATVEECGKLPVTNVAYDASKAPAQCADITNILKNIKGSIGFYNEHVYNTEAGDLFDNTMVSVAMGDMTPADGQKTMEDWYAANAWKK
jgi:raffinose/stachyose/melibiose transport system substrate-binding protein